MKSLLRNLYNLIPDLYLLSKQKYSAARKRSVLLTYVRLWMKELFQFTYSDNQSNTTETVCGFSVDTYNRQTVWFLFREIFIKGEYAFLTDSPSPKIIDCGSNIGLSVLFFKWLYPDCVIHAFEPDPKAFLLLEQNIRKNNLSSVTAHHTALGTHEGTVTLYTNPKNPASLTTSTLQERKNSTPIEVPLTTLSSHIREPVDFLKIDTEGAEAAILNELCNTHTLRYVEEMVIEYHHNIHGKDSSLSVILADIEHAGFQYQIHALFSPLIKKNRFQDLMLYCYRHRKVQ